MDFLLSQIMKDRRLTSKDSKRGQTDKKPTIAYSVIPYPRSSHGQGSRDHTVSLLRYSGRLSDVCLEADHWIQLISFQT